jgi:two-component system cell cycle sensor histidine kinase/response regulator CckA
MRRAPPMAALDAHPYPAGAVGRILVVDDEDAVRRVVQRALRAYGYEVLEASDGPAALSLLAGEATRPHLVLTDERMPDMSGRELAAVIARVYPAVRVVLMSGATAEPVHPGPDVHGRLQKPFSPSSLVAAVRLVLDRPTG